MDIGVAGRVRSLGGAGGVFAVRALVGATLAEFVVAARTAAIWPAQN